MKRLQEAQAVEMIPLDRISVINPRVRNKKIFKEIIANIGELGLKKPITVTRRADADGPRYDLVCGQGRLEAYQALGQHEIPALVVDADTEDCLIMSLVENLARRQHRAIDLLHDIEGLKINRNLNGQRRVRPLSSNALIRAYQEDVDRKRLLIRKAETTRNRLIFVTEAVRKLLIDENFLTLLRAEGLDTLPRNLAARVEVGAQA